MKFKKKQEQPKPERPIPKTKVFKIDWVGQINFTEKGLKKFLKNKFQNDEMLHEIKIVEIKEEKNG